MSPVSGYSSLSNRAGSSMPGPALENQDKSIGGATRRPPERRIFDIMSEVCPRAIKSTHLCALNFTQGL
jgi:hypothetical protein